MHRSVRILLTLCLAHALGATLARAEAPKLVVMISVDMLRGDSIDRVRDRLAPDGFRHFLDHGFEFRNANYLHAATVTAAGHATLATGASPGRHGLVGNSWFDSETKKQIYCVADPTSKVHGEKSRRSAGSSPANILVSTLGDEMRRQLGSSSRAFGVSLKDRSAIIFAGHEGKAFWLSRKAAQFSTSSFYYEERKLPLWMLKFRREHPAANFAGERWTLLHEQQSYVLRDGDARAEEFAPFGSNVQFPHVLPKKTAALVRGLLHAPAGDRYTLDFVEALVDGERLGLGEGPDFLGISLSATDYIGHAFGPQSLEYEDNILQVDRSIARLLRMLDERLGLANIVVALSADHGTDASPEFRRRLCESSPSFEPGGAYAAMLDPDHRYASPNPRGCDSGRHDPKVFLKDANGAMRSQFHVRGDVVIAYRHPSLYLDEKKLRASDLNLGEVSSALAEYMASRDGIALALTRSELASTAPTEDARIERMRRGFHPGRSGHVMLTANRFWHLYQNPHEDASMHGSPYPYDTHVPLLFVGAGIRGGQSDDPVAPSDLAPTLASILGIKMPDASGTALAACLRAGEWQAPGIPNQRK